MTRQPSSDSLETQARKLVDLLHGHWHGTYGVCFCPAHADKKSPSLSVQIGHSAVLYICWAGCEREDIVRAIRQINPGLRSNKSPTPPSADDDGRSAAIRTLVERLWTMSIPVPGTKAAHYLAARGVSAEGAADLRFLLRTKHGLTGQWLPAMIGAIRDRNGTVVALHRTFLDPTGPATAAVDDARLMLGSPGHGHIALAEPDTELGLAEGIEKALAASAMTGCPTWSTWSAGQLPAVRIPERITRLRIFADNDRPSQNFPTGTGNHFARKAAEAHARPGRTITIEPPPPAFHDWDAYKRAVDAANDADALAKLLGDRADDFLSSLPPHVKP